MVEVQKRSPPLTISRDVRESPKNMDKADTPQMRQVTLTRVSRWTPLRAPDGRGGMGPYRRDATVQSRHTREGRESRRGKPHNDPGQGQGGPSLISPGGGAAWAPRTPRGGSFRPAFTPEPTAPRTHPQTTKEFEALKPWLSRRTPCLSDKGLSLNRAKRGLGRLRSWPGPPTPGAAGLGGRRGPGFVILFITKSLQFCSLIEGFPLVPRPPPRAWAQVLTFRHRDTPRARGPQEEATGREQGS